jgi:inhibitor of KinA sporulation pathway (predicted exonuclease)
MHYIVMDLEWNQAMSSRSSVFNHLPIHLRGEIIQIGAVRLNDDFTPGDEFQIDVHPVYFRKMHYKVKKLTGIDSERLRGACGFKEAMEKFRAWCGDGCTFLTWGFDDRGIFEQNIIIHDLDWDWIAGWVNLQLIYNSQVEGDRNQKALHTAMEHFGIEQTRVAHDALGDAYNTGLVCSYLDLARGLTEYDETVRQLALRQKKKESAENEGPEPLEHVSFNGYAQRADVFADKNVACIRCPICGAELASPRWLSQGDRRYMTMAECPEHGKLLARLKLRCAEDETWSANRIIYPADESVVQSYNEKVKKGRRRHRGGKRRTRREKPEKAE